MVQTGDGEVIVEWTENEGGAGGGRRRRMRVNLSRENARNEREEGIKWYFLVMVVCCV
jgi:hypothetical protein